MRSSSIPIITSLVDLLTQRKTKALLVYNEIEEILWHYPASNGEVNAKNSNHKSWYNEHKDLAGNTGLNNFTEALILNQKIMAGTKKLLFFM